MEPIEADLEWTGERHIPGRSGTQVELEHQHRYRFAAELVEGLRVLDAASGEGYGSQILGARAASVTGVELDAETVEHARRRYRSCTFVRGDVTALPFEAASFDAVVSFETVEHVEEPAVAFAEFFRILIPGGLLIVSTPNVSGAPDTATDVNPFHHAELDEPALRAALAQFEIAAILRQATLGASVLGPIDAARLSLSTLPGEEGEARFHIAIAHKPGAPRVREIAGELTPSGLLERSGGLVREYSEWLRDSQGVVKRIETQHRQLEQESRRQRAEFLSLEGKARIWLAERDELRSTNQRLADDYTELLNVHNETLSTVSALADAVRALGR